MDCTETVSSKHDFAEAFLHGIMCQNCTVENSLRIPFVMFIPTEHED